MSFDTNDLYHTRTEGKLLKANFAIAFQSELGRVAKTAKIDQVFPLARMNKVVP